MPDTSNPADQEFEPGPQITICNNHAVLTETGSSTKWYTMPKDLPVDLDEWV